MFAARQPIRVRMTVLAVTLGLFALALPLEAGKSKFNRQLSVGDSAPDWSDLPGVDGQSHSLGEYQKSKLLVLVFTGELCPVSKLYDQRLIALSRAYGEKQLQIVAINVDKPVSDSLKRMQTRAADRQYPFPYVQDTSRKTARSYGATVTPHFFVLDADRKVAYMGAFDDQLKPEKVEKPYLTDAVEALLAGKKPPVAETLQRGCEIQYESKSPADDE